MDNQKNLINLLIEKTENRSVIWSENVWNSRFGYKTDVNSSQSFGVYIDKLTWNGQIICDDESLVKPLIRLVEDQVKENKMQKMQELSGQAAHILRLFYEMKSSNNELIYWLIKKTKNEEIEWISNGPENNITTKYETKIGDNDIICAAYFIYFNEKIVVSDNYELIKKLRNVIDKKFIEENNKQMEIASANALRLIKKG